MEVKDLSSLNPNPSNPRTITRTTFNTLKEGMKQFGDLSCIIMNRRTNQLVGGHQRVESLKAIMDNGQVVILEQLPEPNEVGTVATGYIQYGTERYKFRVVDWDTDKATAAAISANHLHGDDDNQLLAEANYFLTQNAPDLLALTGQSEKEIEKLLKSVSGDEEPPATETNQEQPEDEKQEQPEDEKMVFKLTPDQAEIVHLVVNNWIRDNGAKADDNGSALYAVCLEYTRNHPLSSTERLDDVPTSDINAGSNTPLYSDPFLRKMIFG